MVTVAKVVTVVASLLWPRLLWWPVTVTVVVVVALSPLLRSSPWSLWSRIWGWVGHCKASRMPPRGVNCRIWVHSDHGHVGVVGLGLRASVAWSETETVGYRAQEMRMVANGCAHFGAAQNLADVVAEVGKVSGSSR
ncbi:hypothetical protein EDB84DRAFT_1434117 [Lactarius hengduanensis]|nr:hypothetical protein EDB84DRAFT_1434117 [Lactarius hengduanensis]